LIPEYSTAPKNKKKKLRNKHQKELEDLNLKNFEEWKAENTIPSFHPEAEIPMKKENSKEDEEAEVISKNTKKEKEVFEEDLDPTSGDNQEEKVASSGPKIDEDVKLKICDLGNGCWTHHHFSSEIQTRQYRSPETIIGLSYGTSADIWSFACMIFEMITGDFLFEPRKGHNFDKDDDHLAQMMEILGKMPKNIAFSGRLSKRFFDKTGHLLKIRGLQHWPLKKVLMEKYRFVESEAESLADFLLPMLEWYPEKRATAKEMLDHPWLDMKSNYEYLLNDRDYQVMILKNKLTTEPSAEENKEMSELGESEVDLFYADFEDNNSTMSDEDDDEFFTVTGTKTIAKKNHFSEDEDIDTRLPGPNYLNNSFTGPYPEDMNREYVDKGPNPQFLELEVGL
jgi:serine/threonine protein kinase